MERPSDLDRLLADAQALAHVGSWEWDRSGDRIWWSDELCRIHGRPPGFSPTVAEVLEHLHPDDRPRMAGELDHALGEFDYRIVRADDAAVRHVHGHRGARHDATGEVTHFYGTSQDVTEQREAELARDAARELFAASFSHASVGMALTDLEGRWLKLNTALCRITGWSQAELIARSFQEITHPDDLDPSLAHLQRLRAGEISDFQVEKRYLTASGGYVPVAVSGSLVRDRAGVAQHIVCHVQDISARKQAEEKLREAELRALQERDHAQTIISAMHEGYALTVDGTIVTVNEALCRMFGYPERELTGLQPPYPFSPVDQRQVLAAAGGRAYEEDGITTETVFIRRDGSRFDAEVTVRVARGPQGEVLGLVNTVRDVSERNRRQRELEHRARTDSLTGLANRHVLDTVLAREATRPNRGGTLALVLLDLDYFKQINDRHGHPVGDAVLVEVARRLSGIVRDGEVLARVGGEEFAWLLPGCDVAGAGAGADRARAVIVQDPFHDVGSLTMSAGVAVAQLPCEGPELYRLADRALYDAKQAGRDRTCMRLGDGELLGDGSAAETAGSPAFTG